MQSPHTRFVYYLITLIFLSWTENISGQEHVFPLKSNPVIQNLAQTHAKSYRNPYTKLCPQPDVAELEVTVVDNPTCKFGDGGFSVQVLTGTPPYDFYLNDNLVSAGQTAPNIDFENLFAGAYFVRIVDANDFEYELAYALNDEDAAPISPGDWRLRKSFCDTPGSIGRGVAVVLREYEVFDVNGASQGIFDAGIIQIPLPKGIYSLRAEEVDGCRAFWIFEVKPEITLELPYFEDFSSSLGYPDYLKWEDKYAYINRSYGINPFSIGVATLDGFNEIGQPYVQGDGADNLVDGAADELTSRPFCLNDFTAADSIYFSFAYQPTGLGDFPNEEDALSLDFWTPIEFDSTFVDTTIVDATAITYMDGTVEETLIVSDENVIYIDDDYIIVMNDDTGEIISFNLTDGTASVSDTIKFVFGFLTATVNDTIWNEVWRAEGLAFNQNPDFKQAILNVPDTLLYDGFRFRFRNHATITGNNDHWHLDYLKMEAERAHNDTLHFDVAFAQPAPSIVKRYQAMPWHQFIGHVETSLAERSELPICVRNLDITADNNVSVRYEMMELCTESVISVIPNSLPDVGGVNWGQFPANSIQCSNTFFDNIEARDSIIYYRDNDVIFDDRDSVVIETEWILESTFDADTNDYLYRQQQFFNYYAYDDGTAEAAYGLFGSGAKFAYQIVLNEPDSVRGVMINFVNQNFQSDFLGFQLAVWDKVTENTNEDNLLYETGLITPNFIDMRDGFWTYVFDEAVAVTDTFYIGFVQSGEDLLNMGFDRNTNSREHILINYSGTWEQSIQEGAVMLRPVVGKALPPSETINVGIETPNKPLEKEADLRLYPNPASENLRFDFAGNANPRFAHIFDYSGKLVANVRLTGDNNIAIHQLPDGMYLIRFHDENNRIIGTGKFLKTR